MNFTGNLTPNGRPIFGMGGKQAYKTTGHMGFVVSLEWVNTGKRTTPCMVIWPERTGSNAVEAGAWCIGRAAITEFVDGNAPTVKCIHEARDALRTLGKDQADEQALSALVEAVVKFAPELLLMPATPQPANEQAFAETA